MGCSPLWTQTHRIQRLIRELRELSQIAVLNRKRKCFDTDFTDWHQFWPTKPVTGTVQGLSIGDCRLLIF
jgi:hypothetical protein